MRSSPRNFGPNFYPVVLNQDLCLVWSGQGSVGRSASQIVDETTKDRDEDDSLIKKHETRAVRPFTGDTRRGPMILRDLEARKGRRTF